MVNFVCKLDAEFYRLFVPDIASDEVIITDRAIAHIKAGHPGDYEIFEKFFAEIVAAPDYIFDTGTSNRLMLIKEIELEDNIAKLILQIRTSSEPEGYKNSIVTFNSISDKRYRQYIRNKKILYAKGLHNPEN